MIVNTARKLTCLLSSVILLSVPLPVLAITIDTVPVGNRGNANDSTGYGGVSYDYRIGTTEVTNAQYVEFLNAVAATDPYGLYNTSMGSTTYGGITRSGSGTSRAATSTRSRPTPSAKAPVALTTPTPTSRSCMFPGAMQRGLPTG